MSSLASGKALPVIDASEQALRSLFPKPIAVVDDDAAQAETVADMVVSIALEPIVISGPFSDMGQFLERVQSESSALVCDHMLTSGRFTAAFNGAEAVAAMYGRCPSVLLTSYLNTEELIPIRERRHFIPSVLTRPQLDNPEILAEALAITRAELDGKVLESRRGARTIVRIERVHIDNRLADVFVDSWLPEAVLFPLSMLPEDRRSEILAAGFFSAEVNTSADDGSDLFFRSIGVAPLPAEDI